MTQAYVYDIKAVGRTIYLYAIRDDKTVVLTVKDFKPFVFYALDFQDKRMATKENINSIKQHVADCLDMSVDGIKYKNLLPMYYARTRKQPYLRVEVEDPCRVGRIRSIEGVHVRECNCSVDDTVRFVSQVGIKTSGWIEYTNETLVWENGKVLQYTVPVSSIVPIESDRYAIPCILAFDIETYAHDPDVFSDSSHPEDVIFQISLIFSGSCTDHVLLTIGEAESDGTFNLISCKDELTLLSRFYSLIREYNPHIITGWNIYKFDMAYIIDRTERYLSGSIGFETNPYRSGVLPFMKGQHINRSWKSSAYGVQVIQYMEMNGRIIIDLMVYAQREVKMDSYKLDHFGEVFLKSPKVPMSYHDMFSYFKMSQEGHPDAYDKMSLVAKYCIQDSVIVSKLFDYFQVWFTITEMGSICNIPPSYVFTKGQQVKVFSQIYKYCLNNAIAVDVPDITNTLDYQGATVKRPEVGIYDYVIPYDFSSLYPTIMIAYNIDYTSLVDPSVEQFPDSDCSVIEWGEYKFRFYKHRTGILPSIAEHLLGARRDVRKKMKTLDPNSSLYKILNQRQLSYKVSCNSLYGAMGVKRGMAPLIEGAQSVTAMGRKSLEIAMDYLQNQCKAHVLYGDTDSCYVQFPNIPPEQLIPHARKIEQQIKDSGIFPKPMCLEFEGDDGIYDPFMILTKKRYIWRYLKEDGSRPRKLGTKGVMLSRRDNCKFFRDTYGEVVDMIFDKKSKNDIFQFIADAFHKCLTFQIPVSDFIITKSVKKKDEYKAYNECQGSEEKSMEKLPAHIQMVYRMKQRGEEVHFGTRVPYVITDILDHTHKLAHKVETPEYIKANPFIRIDYLYYMSWFSLQLDQVLECAFSQKFTKKQFKYMALQKDCLSHLKTYFNRIVIEES